MMKTKIIYEDAHILVCYKPAGLATQTAKVGQQDMVSELKNYLAGKSAAANRAGAKAVQPYLGIIHRLDQPVEGLLVFAKNSSAAARLTSSLGQGTLNKQYYAVVCGQPCKKSAELVDYLTKDPATGSAIVAESISASGAAVAAGDGREARKAVLQYQVVKQLSTPTPMALLDIHIDTGRFHQIRAQMAHAGLPLLGDSRYGSQQSRQSSQALNVRSVALCAYRITLKHPVTGKLLDFAENPKGQIFSKFI